MNSVQVQYVIQLVQQGDTNISINALKDLQSQTDDTSKSLLGLGDKTKQAINAAAGIRAAVDALADYDHAMGQLNNTTWTADFGKQPRTAADASKQFLDLDQKRKDATRSLSDDLNSLGKSAENNFASGMSRAFVSIIQGTKSAGDAFKQFAAQFMEQVAQMILQTLILRAVQSAVGFGLGGGGGGSGWPSSFSVNADGGAHFRRAAAGVMLAATGIQGVSQVNGPTYFPRFNTLAGEAGSEMLTVFARPQSSLIGGLPVITGDVGPDKLAILSQQTLSRLVRGGMHPMAGGGMSGGIAVSNISPQPNGKIIVELTPHPAYEQRVVKNSIEGARVQVATDINTDSAIRRAVKGVI